MKITLLLCCWCAAIFLGCKKMGAPEETCFIPYVDFVAHHVDPTTLEVTFTSITAFNGTILSHHWDFGDGTTFSGPNPPPHRYPAQDPAAATSSYRVKYTVKNDCGESYWTKDVIIGACLADVSFQYVMLNDSTVRFTNTSSSPSPVTYEWNFGDGNTSTSSPSTFTRTYTQDHNYTVTLKATNACGENYFTRTVSICRPPVPALTVTQSSCATITANAAATRNGARYQWDFGNGTVLPATPGTAASITYTYPAQGSYNLRLAVINPSGCDTAYITQPVVIQGATVIPNTAWSYTSNDLQFVFERAAVTNATAYNWNFGDGTGASMQNPGAKTFADPGVYTITMKASSDCGAHEFSVPITVPFYKRIGSAPNTGFREVVAISPQEIYFLGSNGKLYRTDTAGQWSAPINLPSSLNFNNETHLFRDKDNQLWIYGRREVARFNPATGGWNSFWASTGFGGNTTIRSMTVDGNGVVWTIGNREIRRGSQVVDDGDNVNYASIAYSPSGGKMWITASNRNTIYAVPVNGTNLTSYNVAGITDGADQAVALSSGEVLFATQTGIVRISNNGSLVQQYNLLTTAGQLTGKPARFLYDGAGQIWAVQGGKLLKIPAAAPSGTKNYSINGTLGNLAYADLLRKSGQDLDLILAKNENNGAIQVH